MDARIGSQAGAGEVLIRVLIVDGALRLLMNRELGWGGEDA